MRDTNFPAISTDDMCCWLFTAANCKQANSFLFYHPSKSREDSVVRPADRPGGFLLWSVPPPCPPRHRPRTNPARNFFTATSPAGHGLARGLQPARTLFFVFRSGIIPFLRCLQRKGRGRRVHTYLPWASWPGLACAELDWGTRSDTCATLANLGS